MWLLLFFLLGAAPAWAEDLGELSAHPFNPDSTANPFGAGSPFKSEGINNPFSAPMAVRSAINRRRIRSPQMRRGSMTSRETIAAS